MIFETWSLGLAIVALIPMKVSLFPSLLAICLHLETIRL